ncbi:MAG: sugar phosphate isomerase/epimerase family protein [Bacteroidota bacterium]
MNFSDQIVCAYLYAITKYGYPPSVESTLTQIEEMAALGFSSIELEGIREDHLAGIYAMKDEISKKVKRKDLTVPYFCGVLPALSSLDSHIRDEQLKLFEMACEVASVFNSIGVLDNAPLPPFQFPADIPIVRHYDEDTLNAAYWSKEVSWDRYWDQLVNTYRTACEIANQYQLKYVMHPAVGVLASGTDSFLRFHDAVKMDNLRFNFDTANQFVMKENLSLALRRLKDHVDYIHISDNGGTQMEHLAIGQGKIRWDVFFETLETIDFRGHVGIDIGGAESDVEDLNAAYKNAGRFVSDHWHIFR